MVKKEETYFEMRVFNVTKDIPYSDTFNVEENWIVTSTHPNA